MFRPPEGHLHTPRRSRRPRASPLSARMRGPCTRTARVTIRALIVDEVFDANDLDIAIIEAAIAAGVAVSLVGDPWQALYLFRGAQPEQVHELLKRTRVRTLPLRSSFRWRTDSQRHLAIDLRGGWPVTLPTAAVQDVDVVLALWWRSYRTFMASYRLPFRLTEVTAMKRLQPPCCSITSAVNSSTLMRPTSPIRWWHSTSATGTSPASLSLASNRLSRRSLSVDEIQSTPLIASSLPL